MALIDSPRRNAMVASESAPRRLTAVQISTRSVRLIVSRLADYRIRFFEIRPELSCRHEEKHSEVTDEGPEGVAESRRGVLLEQEVAGPGESVSDRNPQKRVPGVPGRERYDRGENAEGRPRGVHKAIGKT